jgi:hypothetical protein
METDVFCKTRLLINRNGILTEKAGCWTRRFITVFTTSRQRLLSWARSIQSVSSQTISTSPFLICYFYLRLRLPRCLFPNNLLEKPTFNSDTSDFYRLPSGTRIWPVTRNCFSSRSDRSRQLFHKHVSSPPFADVVAYAVSCLQFVRLLETNTKEYFCPSPVHEKTTWESFTSKPQSTIYMCHNSNAFSSRLRVIRFIC